MEGAVHPLFYAKARVKRHVGVNDIIPAYELCALCIVRPAEEHAVLAGRRGEEAYLCAGLHHGCFGKTCLFYFPFARPLKVCKLYFVVYAVLRTCRHGSRPSRVVFVLYGPRDKKTAGCKARRKEDRCHRDNYLIREKCFHTSLPFSVRASLIPCSSFPDSLEISSFCFLRRYITRAVIRDAPSTNAITAVRT